MRRLKSLLTYIFTIKLVYCGTVSDLIDYQLYKDFAMNKGQFKVGAVNGEMDIDISGESKKTFAITGGSNIKGDINVSNTDLILSGGRDLHAGEKIKDTTVNGDYYYSEFNIKNS